MRPGNTEIIRAHEILRRDPLKNVVLLKFLDMALGRSNLHQVVDGDDVASLLLVDHRFSSFDQRAYPTARVSVVISSTRPELTREVLVFAPRGEPLIFKLTDEADRLVVAEEFPLKRRTAYHSYTSSRFAVAAPGADVEFALSDALSRMFMAQDHDPEWLGSMIGRNRAFISVVKEDSQPLSACFAFHIDGAIWEIGGVYTIPTRRGEGLGSRAVRTALAELARRRCVPRYHVAEENTASIRLAESLGMTRFLTLTHYLSEA
jgi:ribosomal protein S18 acetylase RimI-like enzyme